MSNYLNTYLREAYFYPEHKTETANHKKNKLSHENSKHLPGEEEVKDIFWQV